MATLTLVFSGISSLTLALALIFAVIQVRDARRGRQDMAAIEAIRAMQGPNFANSWRSVFELPIDCPVDEVNGDQGRKEVADDLILTFETLGYLVFKRVVPIGVAEDLVGGMVTGAWRRLQPWALHSRKAMQAPGLMEWFQWLSDRLEENRKPSKNLGAFATFTDWKP